MLCSSLPFPAPLLTFYPVQVSFEGSAVSMASPPSLEPSPLLKAEASGNPPTLADSFDEAIHNQETFLVEKAAVKVSWAVSTSSPISTSPFISTSPSTSTSTHNTTSSQDAILHLRYEPVTSEAYLALRFPRIVLEVKNKNRSHAFFVFFAPEDIISLVVCDSGTSCHLDVRMRQPPGLVGPDCPWTGRDGSEVDLEQIRTLGLEVAACTISVLAKDSIWRQGRPSVWTSAGIAPPAYSQVLDAGADGSQRDKAKATALDSPPVYRAPAVAGSSRNAEEAAGKPFSRPPKRFRLSDTTAAAGAAASCRKCDEVARSVTQNMGEVMSQLSHLTETVQRLTERMDGLESSIAAKAQAADWKGEFVEKDDLVETVAAQVESEMDGVSDHLEEKAQGAPRRVRRKRVRGEGGGDPGSRGCCFLRTSFLDAGNLQGSWIEGTVAQFRHLAIVLASASAVPPPDPDAHDSSSPNSTSGSLSSCIS
ncbi:hypothetical protein PG994_015238 [Apiospora phragmitis]|uniref:Uncharacterized protein n=1 Tax=Apiospora phragmitis TaxID=2905665 RepID=A0ABR1SSA5_9PEZI